MPSRFDVLSARMNELRDLNGAIALATWDQQTFLPKKAALARGSQLATLQGLYHQRLVDPALVDLIASCTGLTGDDAAMVRVLVRERDRAVRVPQRLVQALAEAQSRALAAWLQARAENRFAPFQQPLDAVLQLRREEADAIGHGGERYDALLDLYEPGMKVARLGPVLDALRSSLVPMVRAQPPRPGLSQLFAGKRFDAAAQWELSLELLAGMGFDLEAGRQDRSVHPFSTSTHPLDVRLTTRIDETNPLVCLLIVLHEGGHGLYLQGFTEAHYRTPLAQVASMGLDESQSRLWENLVGRSLPFWRWLYPKLQAAFRDALGEVPLDTFFSALNRVAPTLLRGQADELTYNLHIVLRYELELQLMRGNLPTADLPAAWSEKMQALLGLTPPDALTGVLQDVHWAEGAIGYFPTYTLGNLYGASLLAAARRAMPGLDGELERGDLLPLGNWLRTHVHAEGYRYDAETLVTRLTGRGLTDADFVAHLRARYPH